MDRFSITIVLLSLFGACLGREVLQTMTFTRASVSISPRPSHMRPPRVSHVVHPMRSPSPSPSMEPPTETPASPPMDTTPPSETPASPPMDTTPPMEPPMEVPEEPSPSPSPVHATVTCTPELSVKNEYISLFWVVCFQRYVRTMNHSMSSVHVSCRSVSAFAGSTSCRVHHNRSYAAIGRHRGYGVYTPSSSICCQLCAHVPWCRSWSRTYSSGYCYMGSAHSRGTYHSDSCGGNMWSQIQRSFISLGQSSRIKGIEDFMSLSSIASD